MIKKVDYIKHILNPATSYFLLQSGLIHTVAITSQAYSYLSSWI